MKGIKEWIEEMNKNEEFSKKFADLEDPKDVVALANKEGYEFTVDDLMDLKMEAVSGGFGFQDFGNLIRRGYKWVDKVWRSDEVRKIRRTIHKSLADE